jgi:hypothetical protein
MPWFAFWSAFPLPEHLPFFENHSARTRWDLGRPIDDQRHFRLLSNVQWCEEQDTLEYSKPQKSLTATSSDEAYYAI